MVSELPEKGEPMDGVWIKRCPHCKNYMKKKDPQEEVMCCACGWQEHELPFFCETTNSFCLVLPSSNGKSLQGRVK
jgi:hypothetical protein